MQDIGSFSPLLSLLIIVTSLKEALLTNLNGKYTCCAQRFIIKHQFKHIFAIQQDNLRTHNDFPWPSGEKKAKCSNRLLTKGFLV